MDKFFGIAEDSAGNVMVGASAVVYAFGTSNRSSLYLDDQTTSLANPITTGSDGRFEFCAADGVYDVVVTKGEASATFTHVVLSDAAAVSVPYVRRWFSYTSYGQGGQSPVFRATRQAFSYSSYGGGVVGIVYRPGERLIPGAQIP